MTTIQFFCVSYRKSIMEGRYSNRAFSSIDLENSEDFHDKNGELNVRDRIFICQIVFTPLPTAAVEWSSS